MVKAFVIRGAAAITISTFALVWTATAMAAQAPVVLHVSPQGDDRNPGSASRPVRTLTRAQALVRASNLKADVTVEIAPGAYRLDSPLVFTAADGGQGGHRVTWRGAAGARPLISGGFDVTGFKPFDEKRRLYVADIPKGLDTRQVWVDDTLAERPWLEIKPSDVRFNATGFEIVNPDLAFLSTLKHPERLEVEATGFFTDRISPVAAIDGARVTMRQPAWDNNTWGYDTLSKPIFPEDSRLFLVNAPELIGRTNDWHARPYQWFVDPKAGKLYLRIAEDDDIRKLRVTVPALPVLASISGTPQAPVRNLTFQGLRFSYTSCGNGRSRRWPRWRRVPAVGPTRSATATWPPASPTPSSANSSGPTVRWVTARRPATSWPCASAWFPSPYAPPPRAIWSPTSAGAGACCRPASWARPSAWTPWPTTTSRAWSTTCCCEPTSRPGATCVIGQAPEGSSSQLKLSVQPR